MTHFRQPALIAALVASTLVAAVLPAHAASIVVNGSLSAEIANNGVPAGWRVIEGSPDVMDAQNNVGVAGTTRFGATPDASPDGGTWVGLGAYEGYTERFGQALSGLTVGQTYAVSWLVGNFGYSSGSVSYLGSNALDVLVDGVSVGSGATHALGSQWFLESLNFTATASSQELSFKLASSQKAYLSVDGIAVSAASAPAVPEPSRLALLGWGLVGISVVARRRR